MIQHGFVRIDENMTSSFLVLYKMESAMEMCGSLMCKNLKYHLFMLTKTPKFFRHFSDWFLV